MPQQEVRYSRYVDDLTFSSAHPLHADLPARIAHLIQEWNYQINSSKTRVSQRSQAVVHGLIWNQDRLDFPTQFIKQFRQKIQRIQAQVDLHPTPQVWMEAAQLWTDVKAMSSRLYGSSLPEELQIPKDLIEQIQKHTSASTPRWVDELWG